MIRRSYGHRIFSALWIGLLFAAVQLVEASIYPIQSRLWIPPFEHAEKMFASNLGPVLSRKGASTITVNVTGVNVTADMNDWRMVVLFFYVESFETFQAVEDKLKLFACANDPAPLTGLTGVFNAERIVFPVQNESVGGVAKYDVDLGGWTNTQIFICSDVNGAAEVMPFTGTMEVRNPFGLLPAVLYGMFPFSGALAIGYTLLDVYFTTLLIIHRKQMLQLHFGILIVLIMGIGASATWFYAFYEANQSGERVYPYPKPFLAAVILDTLMRTMARTLLVVVCLGYGIVRDSLTRCEVTSIVFLSLGYLVSGIGDEVTRGTSTGAEFREKPTAWSFVQLFCNLLFIMWIHFALDRILKQLQDTKQSAKLGMYKALAWSLGAFIVFFTALTLVAVCSKVGVFDWPVELEWMQLVAWPVLNFIVSAAMCVIWRPTANSSQFAFSMQLSMTDDSECSSIEMAESAVSRDSDDDDEFFNRDFVIDERDDQVEIELSPPKEGMGKDNKSDKLEDEKDKSRTHAASAGG